MQRASQLNLSSPLEQGAKDLVLVSNNAGSGEHRSAALLKEKRVR